MAATLSHRFGPEDAAFLYFEKASAPLHVGSLGVYEGRISFDALVRHLESRLHTIPRYRQRAVPVPFHLGFPRWQDDPDFDIRHHVRRFRIRGAIDDRRLLDVASGLFAPMMERDRPLWDITLIEGLTGGRSALLARAHHCMVDGVSGLALLVALLDLTPQPREIGPPQDKWEPQPQPRPLDMVSDAAFDLLQQQVRVWSDVLLLALDREERRSRVRTVARSLQKAARFLLTPAPPASFNASLQPRRRLAWTDMPFADLRAIRSTCGGTINDVALAILAGALARYERRHAAKATPELRCLIPVNVRREEEDGTLGNRVSFMLAGLPLAVSEPLRRLAIIQQQMRELKQVNQAEGVDLVARLLGQVFPPLAAVAGALPTPPNTIANLVCTNVPGPMVPLFCVGHRMLAHYPLAPIAWDMGVNVGVMSYDQRLFWGLVADEAALPDPEQLARDLDDAFVELREAAGVTPISLPPIRPTTPARRQRKAAPPAAAAAPGSNGRPPAVVMPATRAATDQR